MYVDILDKVCKVEVMEFQLSLQFLNSSSFRWVVFVDLSIEIGGIGEALMNVFWLN
jgi:hypothetical protein